VEQQPAHIAYLPMDRRHAIAEGVELPTRCEGTVLFADFCGYTSLTDALVAEFGRKRGAELLSQYMNRGYSAAIGAVHAQRGSVVGFSGDAITCWFDGDDGSGAIHCALAMLASLADVAPVALSEGETRRLQIKVALASGPASRLLVGDAGERQLDVLVGSSLQRMSEAEEVAGPSEVIGAAEVLSALADRLQVAERRRNSRGDLAGQITGISGSSGREPWPELPAEAMQGSDILRFLPAAVRQRIEGGHGEFLAEIRGVASLFVQLPALDFEGADGVFDQLDGMVRRIQQAVRRYDGEIIDFSSNARGSHLYTAFGAPTAHEDDADRAVSAALAIRAGLEGAQLGVGRGSVRAGATGSATRRAYAAIGDAANTAARLMDRAEVGQILASESVIRALRRPIQTAVVGELKLKGKSSTTRVHEVTAAGGASRVAAVEDDIIGRIDERALFDRRLRQLTEDGEGGCLMVVGEAGIGKSRLLQHFRRQAVEAGLTVLHGGADAIENATPYFPWRAPLTQLLSGGPADDGGLTASLIRRLEREDDPRWLQLAPLLSAVVPIALGDNALTTHMDGGVRADNTVSLILHLLGQLVSAGPLVLIVEDAHWFDSASWALTRAIVEKLPQLLVVLSSRPLPDQAFPALDAITAAGETGEIRLTALPGAHALSLVSRRLGVRSLPESVARLILEHAEGNPFFSEEIACNLRDSGVLAIQDGECHLAPGTPALASLDFPETVEGLVTSRLDRLSPSQQLLVKVGSVIGRRFSPATIVDIFPVEEEREALPGELRLLVSRDIFELVSGGRADFSFRHAIFREVAYGLMPSDVRAQLHLRLAEWYEASDVDAATIAPLLAHHWGRAVEDSGTARPRHFKKAIHYCEQAGAQSISASAYREAIRFFDRAVSLEEQRLRLDPGTETAPEIRAHWASQMGLARLGLTQYRQARQHNHQAVALMGQPMPSASWRIAFRLMGQTLIQGWHLFAPASWWRDRDAGRAPTRRTLAAMYNTLSESHYMFGELLPLLCTALHALNNGEHLGSTSEHAEAVAALSCLARSGPMNALSRRYAARADQLAEEIDQLPVRSRVLFFTSLRSLTVADWDEAIVRARQCVEVASALGDQHMRSQGNAVLIQALFNAGHTREAWELGALMDRQGRRAHYDALRIWGLVGRAQAGQRMGLFADSLADLDVALDLLRGSTDKWSETVAHGLSAQAYLHTGRPDMALASAQRTLALMREYPIPTQPTLVWGYKGAAQVFRVLWADSVDPVERRELEQNARWMARRLHVFRYSFPLGQPHGWLFQAEVHEQAGKRGKALRSWRRALAEAEALDLPYERGLALLGMVEGPEDPRLGEAIALLQRAEAIFDLGRARRLLPEPSLAGVS